MRPHEIVLAASMLTVSSEASAQEAGDARRNTEPFTELRAPGLIVGGVGLILAAGGGASALFYAASQVDNESGGFMSGPDFDSAFKRIGFGLGGAVLAAGALGGGLTMIAVGAKRVPKEPNDPALPSEPLGLMPSAVTMGPTSVAITWSF